jgi:uncharacterized protein
MANDLLNFNKDILDQTGQQSVAKTFVANVFSYMTLALAISGIAAYFCGSRPDILLTIFNNGLLKWLVILAPLGMVMIMSFAFNKLGYKALLGLFLLYSAVNGISLGSIFLVYDISSIATVFFITAGLFATMAIIGYTTKTDLTKFGSILMMALVGLLIASVVNWFMNSDTMSYIISCIGVLIFTGLTAYDTQKIKNIGANVEYGSESAGKLALMGALRLYLDFINLFLMLLRILGGRRSD